MQAPFKRKFHVNVPALGTDVEANYIGCEAPFAGVLTSAEFIPVGSITGAATNHRKLEVINKGQSGVGTTVMASLAFDNGVNAVAFDKKTITNSAVEGARDVAAGDVVSIASTTPGSGIADPGGQWIFTFERAD
jgi:hypothetical protein